MHEAPRNWLDGIDDLLAAANPRERSVLERRTFADPPCTLQVLATELGITRERVRQLEARWIGRPGSIDVAAIDRSLRTMRADRSEPLWVADLPHRDARFRGVDTRIGALAGLLRSFDAEHRIATVAGHRPFVVPREFADPNDLANACRPVLLAPEFATAGLPEKEAAVAAHVLSLGAAELMPVVRDLLVAQGPGVLTLSLAQRVANLLRETGRPLTYTEIQTAVGPVKDNVLGAALEQSAVARIAKGTYQLAPLRSTWANLLPTVSDDVLAFLSCEPDLQWRSEELLVALVEAGAEWAVDLSMATFECLLAEIPGLRALQRSCWGLAAVHSTRLRLQDLAEAELRANADPIHMRDLLERLRQRRSVGSTWRPRYPAVLLGGGMVGLADRDLGMSADAFRSWIELLAARLANGARVDLDEAVALWKTRGSADVPPSILRSILGGEQTLYCRLRENGSD